MGDTGSLWRNSKHPPRPPSRSVPGMPQGGGGGKWVTGDGPFDLAQDSDAQGQGALPVLSAISKMANDHERRTGPRRLTQAKRKLCSRHLHPTRVFPEAPSSPPPLHSGIYRADRENQQLPLKIAASEGLLKLGQPHSFSRWRRALTQGSLPTLQGGEYLHGNNFRSSISRNIFK